MADRRDRSKTPRTSATPSGGETAEQKRVRKFVIAAAQLLHDRHFEDVLIFDLRGLSDVTDYIVIASGTSDRQIVAVGSELEDLAQGDGLERLGHEADASAKWLVMDFIDAVVHLFEPMTRAYYDLEMMWGDAPKVDWRRTISRRAKP